MSDRINKVKLKQHQILPVKTIKKQRGLILFHSTGSGKTITALMAMAQFNKDIVIIGPRSSKKAFNDDMKKLNLDSNRFKFYTYTKIKTIVKDSLDVLDDKCVILDEAHNLRSETSNNLQLVYALEFAYKVIL